MSEAPLVVITGGTGHIGFRVLAQVLEAGYRVRITSRSAASANALFDLPSIRPHVDRLSIATIPDFLAADAFTAVVEGATYIIHVASPIPNATISGSGSHYDAHRDFINPAIQGTLNLLSAAAKEPTVKRIVITASVGNLAPKSPEATSIGPDDLATVPTEEQMASSHWLAYRASKILAHQKANEWVAQHKPSFKVLWVLPGYVMGNNEPIRTAQGMLDRASSNGTMLLYALGKDSPNNEPRSLDLVEVNDVAETHVKLLTAENVEQGERFIASWFPEGEGGAPPKAYSDIDPFVKKLYPEAVENGLLPLGGKVTGARYAFDSTKTTKKLGVQFHGLEEMVKGVIGQYVALSAQEQTQEH